MVKGAQQLRHTFPSLWDAFLKSHKGFGKSRKHQTAADLGSVETAHQCLDSCFYCWTVSSICRLSSPAFTDIHINKEISLASSAWTPSQLKSSCQLSLNAGISINSAVDFILLWRWNRGLMCSHLWLLFSLWFIKAERTLEGVRCCLCISVLAIRTFKHLVPKASRAARQSFKVQLHSYLQKKVTWRVVSSSPDCSVTWRHFLFITPFMY